MPFPTYAVSTELDAVNSILSSVGQAPVTTLDLQNPEVAITLSTLQEVSKQIQSEGWTFNTERDYQLQPDSISKEIIFPPNVLNIDTNHKKHNRDYDVVKRKGKLYDRLNHTYTWDGPIYVDIVWFFDFQDLPPQIQQYVVAKAARLCAVKMISDPTLYELLQEQEGITRASAIEYETRQGDYTMFGHTDGERTYQSYQPFHALNR